MRVSSGSREAHRSIEKFEGSRRLSFCPKIVSRLVPDAATWQDWPTARPGLRLGSPAQHGSDIGIASSHLGLNPITLEYSQFN